MNASLATRSAKANYDFSGRVVVVTGAAGGIGRAICDAFAHHGATAVNWDRIAGNTAGEHAPLHIPIDVTSAESVQAAVNDTLKRFGRIDCLVNNAGFAGSTQRMEDSDPTEWQKVIEVNLMGTYHASRLVVPTMRAAGYGRIVNIASLAGKEGTPNASAYSASKAGVIAMTKSLGKELAQTGVLVNGIAPAAVKTTLLEQMAPEHVQTMINKSPMARLGTVEEVAELTLWLGSDSCSFSTGAIFDLSGGRATY